MSAPALSFQPQARRELEVIEDDSMDLMLDLDDEEVCGITSAPSSETKQAESTDENVSILGNGRGAAYQRSVLVRGRQVVKQGCMSPRRKVVVDTLVRGTLKAMEKTTRDQVEDPCALRLSSLFGSESESDGEDSGNVDVEDKDKDEVAGKHKHKNEGEGESEGESDSPKTPSVVTHADRVVDVIPNSARVRTRDAGCSPAAHSDLTQGENLAASVEKALSCATPVVGECEGPLSSCAGEEALRSFEALRDSALGKGGSAFRSAAKQTLRDIFGIDPVSKADYAVLSRVLRASCEIREGCEGHEGVWRAGCVVCDMIHARSSPAPRPGVAHDAQSPVLRAPDGTAYDPYAYVAASPVPIEGVVRAQEAARGCADGVRDYLDTISRRMIPETSNRRVLLTDTLVPMVVSVQGGKIIADPGLIQTSADGTMFVPHADALPYETISAIVGDASGRIGLARDFRTTVGYALFCANPPSRGSLFYVSRLASIYDDYARTFEIVDAYLSTGGSLEDLCAWEAYYMGEVESDDDEDMEEDEEEGADVGGSRSRSLSSCSSASSPPPSPQLLPTPDCGTIASLFEGTRATATASDMYTACLAASIPALRMQQAMIEILVAGRSDVASQRASAAAATVVSEAVGSVKACFDRRRDYSSLDSDDDEDVNDAGCAADDDESEGGGNDAGGDADADADEGQVRRVDHDTGFGLTRDELMAKTSRTLREMCKRVGIAAGRTKDSTVTRLEKKHAAANAAAAFAASAAPTGAKRPRGGDESCVTTSDPTAAKRTRSSATGSTPASVGPCPPVLREWLRQRKRTGGLISPRMFLEIHCQMHRAVHGLHGEEGWCDYCIRGCAHGVDHFAAVEVVYAGEEEPSVEYHRQHIMPDEVVPGSDRVFGDIQTRPIFPEASCYPRGYPSASQSQQQQQQQQLSPRPVRRMADPYPSSVFVGESSEYVRGGKTMRDIAVGAPGVGPAFVHYTTSVLDDETCKRWGVTDGAVNIVLAHDVATGCSLVDNLSGTGVSRGSEPAKRAAALAPQVTAYSASAPTGGRAGGERPFAAGVTVSDAWKRCPSLVCAASPRVSVVDATTVPGNKRLWGMFTSRMMPSRLGDAGDAQSHKVEMIGTRVLASMKCACNSDVSVGTRGALGALAACGGSTRPFPDPCNIECLSCKAVSARVTVHLAVHTVTHLASRSGGGGRVSKLIEWAEFPAFCAMDRMSFDTYVIGRVNEQLETIQSMPRQMIRAAAKRGDKAALSSLMRCHVFTRSFFEERVVTECDANDGGDEVVALAPGTTIMSGPLVDCTPSGPLSARANTELRLLGNTLIHYGSPGALVEHMCETLASTF